MKLFLLLLFPFSVVSMDRSTQNWDVKLYKDNSGPQVKLALELLATLNLEKCSRILDVGSGAGQVLGHLSAHYPHLNTKGIDASSEMALLATLLYPGNNISFEQVDAQDSKAPFFKKHQNYFDLAFSSAVFLWIKDKQAAIENIHTVLSSGGHIMVKTSSPRQKTHPINQALGILGKNPKWASFVQAYQSTPQTYPLSVDDARKLMNTEKWTRISIAERSSDYVYENSQEFCNWLQGFMGAMPAVAALPKDQQIELCHDFVNIYIQLPEAKNAEGKIIYSLPGILIQADKK